LPLLKSLICFKGADNGRRFLVINLCAYALFILLSPLLAKAAVLLLLLLAVASPILLATAVRRVHDARFALPLALLPVAVFWVNVLGVTYLVSGSAWALLILAVLVTAALTTLSQPGAKRRAHYVMGYFGPVNFNQDDPDERWQRSNGRIEPTLTPNHSSTEVETSNAAIEQSAGNSHAADNVSDQKGLGQPLLSQWIQQHRRLTLLAATMFALAAIVLAIYPAFKQTPVSDPVAAQASQEKIKQRLFKTEMPDNFWIMLDEFDALTIAWQGDIQKDGALWSAITAQGDKTCFQVKFIIRDSYRTMNVTVKNGGDYYADFSPVDTPDLIRSIARRDKFELCGFEFSLKGTQARLMGHKKYADYLSAIE